MATNERPNRLVVALGIATIVLFSANLLAMLSQRVWPQLHEALFASKTQVEETVPEIEFEESIQEFVIEATAPRVVVRETLHLVHPSSRHTVYKILTETSKRKRCRTHRGHRSHTHTVLRSRDVLDLDVERLERDIEREMERLNGDLANVELDLQKAMTIHLNLDGITNNFVRQELDMSKLEANLEAASRKFEVRSREHKDVAKARMAAKLKVMEKENVARRPRVIVRENNQP